MLEKIKKLIEKLKQFYTKHDVGISSALFAIFVLSQTGVTIFTIAAAMSLALYFLIKHDICDDNTAKFIEIAVICTLSLLIILPFVITTTCPAIVLCRFNKYKSKYSNSQTFYSD